MGLGTLAAFGAGVYTGVYVAQVYDMPEIAPPRKLWNRLEELVDDYSARFKERRMKYEEDKLSKTNMVGDREVPSYASPKLPSIAKPLVMSSSSIMDLGGAYWGQMRDVVSPQLYMADQFQYVSFESEQKLDV